MHKCDGLVLICMDWRLYQSNDLLEKIKKITSTNDLDVVALAGSSKNILDLTTKDLVFKHIDLNKKLHSGSKIILTQHENCGAYGESGTKEKLLEDLNNAGKIVESKYPDFKLEKVFIFLKEVEGKWQVEVEKV